MTVATRRILRAAAVLLLLQLGLLGLVNVPRPLLSVPAEGEQPPKDEMLRFTPGQRETADFLDNGRATAGTGRGLFETDFFKPPPAPPPKPKPAAPTTRELALFYRGLAAFPDGARVAYLSVEGNTITLAEGELVAGVWRLVAFDAEQAVLAKADEKVILPFNRRASLSVPVKP